MLCRRKWQPTPVFLPGKSLGWRILVGYSPWGCKESDMTDDNDCDPELHLGSKDVGSHWGKGEVTQLRRGFLGMGDSQGLGDLHYRPGSIH